MNGNFKTFKELKSELIIKYQKFQNFTLQKKIEEKTSQTQGSEIKEILDIVDEEEEKIQKDVSKKDEKTQILKQEDQVTSDIMKAIKDKKFKDFSIFIGDYEIPVHRIVLASRCPKFAKMLTDENVRHFSLFNITTTVFGRILGYLYYDKMPVKTEGEN